MRHFQLSFLILAVVLLFGCKKALDDVRDYYPTVRTESVTTNPDGSVLVTGRIVSEGDAPIDVAGICASTSPLPIMTDNQVLCELHGDHFTATYSGLDAYGTYYFRAWATNANGYSYGDPIQVDSVTAQPVVPPCTWTLNTVSLGAGLPVDTYYYITPITQEGFNYQFQANGGTTSSTYTLGAPLHTGIYTTTSSMDPADNAMHISFFSGFISGSLSAGSPIYVNQLTPTSWEIAICDAPWVNQSITNHYTARFVCHS